MTDRPVRLLIVEDDTEDYLIIQKMLSSLKKHRFELTLVPDCDRAFEKLAKEAFDVCLLDYRLKGRDGLEFLKEITHRGYSTPVIFLTGQGDYEVDVEAMQLGASDFLYKNKIDGDMLERSIRYTLERKRAEENRLRLASIVESSNDAIYSVTLEGIILSWNPGAQRIYGYKPEEIGGRDVSLIVPQGRQDEFQKLFAAVRKGTPVSNFITYHQAKNGREIPVSITLSPIRDPAGQVARTSVIARDIDENEQAKIIQDSLQSERDQLLERLQLQLERMPVACLLGDQDFNFTYWNPAAEKMFGYSFKEAEGRHPGDIIIPPPSRTYAESILKRIARGDMTAQGVHLENIRKDGSAVTCEWYNTPLNDPEGNFLGFMSMVLDVTERKKAQENLVESEERFRRIFQDSPMGMALVAGDSKIMMANPRLCEFIGYSADELTGKSFAEFTHPEDLNKDMEQYLQLAAGKIPSYEMDKRYIHKDGRTLWGHLTVTLVRDGSGKPLYGLGMVSDITESRKADEVKKRLVSILHQTHEAVIVSDRQGHILDWNEGAERIYGYSQEEIRGRSSQVLEPPDRKGEIDSNRRKLLAGKESLSYETVRLRKDGKPIHIAATFTPLRNDKGEITGFFSIARDVTERKKAEEIQAQLAAILQQTPDAVIGSDLEGNLFSWNRGAENVFGYSFDEIVGKPTDLLAPAERKHEVAEMREIALAGESISNFETVRVKKNGESIDVSITFFPIKDSVGKITGISSILRDITEKKSVEESLRKHEEQMRLAEKMNAIGRLAGGVAHDFNNLLSVIGGNADFLLSSLEKENPHRDEVEEIQKAVRRGADLTRQLLVFGRKQVSQPQPVNLNDISGELQKMLKRLLDAHVELTILQDKALKPILADPGQMQQAMMNLALNARDAMPKGGSLIIETRNMEPEDLDLRKNPTLPSGSYVRLSVTDTGEGMDPEVQKRIFEPFFTTKGGKGTGLGLATVYSIVHQWNGHIELHSSPGMGTTFALYFPILEGAASPDAKPRQMTLISQGSETVLVAEDEESVRKILVRTLRKYGYQVLEASNGIEALQKAWGFAAPIDLLLTDTVMPKMNGKELADELRKSRPKLKILFISGYPKEILSQQGILDPGIHLVQKPFELEELVQQMRRVLDEK